jgi:hypothetical protein
LKILEYHSYKTTRGNHCPMKWASLFSFTF